MSRRLALMREVTKVDVWRKASDRPPALARETRRSRTGGPIRQPRCPAWGGDRGSEPALVSGEQRAKSYRCAAANPASGAALDGGHTRRPGRSDWRGLRGQVHAALGVLGGGGGREIHAAA